MPWGKIDDRAWRHDRFDGVGPTSYALYWAAISYSNEKLLDGHLRDHHIAQVCGYRGIARQAADKLIETGLWLSEDGGIYIHDYDQYNPLKAQVLKRRADGAERQAKWLAAQKADQESSDYIKDEVTNAVTNTVTNAANEGLEPPSDSVSDTTIPLPRYPGTPVPKDPQPSISAPAAEAAEKKDAVKTTRGDQSAALWDALIASGFPTPVTKSERDRRNAGIKQLVDAEIAPDEIAIFRAAYIIMFPQAPVTLHGLLNHIAELRAPSSVRPPAAPTSSAPASQYDGPRFNGGYTEDESLKAERQAIDRRGDLAALTGMLAGKVVNIADEKTARASLEEIRAKIGGGGNGKAPRPTYRIKDVGPTADRASPEHRPGDHEAPERTGQSS